MTLSGVPHNLVQVSVVFAVVLFTRWIYTRVTRHSISRVAGPAKSDWFFGNLTDLHFDEVGTPEFSWQKQFGLTFKIYGFLGEEYLMVSDPKALQHIYSDSSTFVRQKQSRHLLRLLFGPGLVAVDGDDHKRQRRVMQPAFGIGNLKALFPVFTQHSQKLLSAIKGEVEARSETGSATINVYNYMASATLDIICDAAFNYEMCSLDRKVGALREIFKKLETKSVGYASKISLLSQIILECFPSWMIEFLSYFPIRRLSLMRKTRNLIWATSELLVQQKVDTYMRGQEDEKDLLSLLVRANAIEESRWKLSDLEVNAEIATIMVGGFTTTASTIAFGLWELAKNPTMQARIRKEIFDIKRQARERGDADIGINQYEDMPLLVAFINEVLRYHPAAFIGNRVATQDSVIPLSHPVTLTSGQVVSEIPAATGQKIWIDISGYNRLPEIFGQDSHEFNIDRWLDGKPNERGSYSRVGVHANLMTFGHGPRACIGWRFSLYETQCLLIDLLSTFEFNLANDGTHVFRMPTVGMRPCIRGNRAAGATLPLNVSILRD